MRSLPLMLVAMLSAGSAAAETDVDPSLGPWWKAPSIQLTLQPEDGDGADPAGFLLPIVDLERSGTGYQVALTSRRVLAGETRPMPECETSGSAGPAGDGRLVGEAGRYGRILLSDLGDGIVRIDFERTEGCARSGRYVATWTAPH